MDLEKLERLAKIMECCVDPETGQIKYDGLMALFRMSYQGYVDQGLAKAENCDKTMKRLHEYMTERFKVYTHEELGYEKQYIEAALGATKAPLRRS